MTHRFKEWIHPLVQPATWVVIIAVAVRLYASLNTHIVNPDGMHYIYQAHAVFLHDWANLTSCRITYISILPFLIAPVYALVGDWIIAGRCVSFALGVATLFPLYFLLKRFFEKRLCLVIVLVYALIPVFVSRSADILRDPAFWFLICAGMLMFVRQWDPAADRRYPLSLLLSCLFFLVSVGARIEGVMFIAASGFYLLICKTDRKRQKLLFFSLPLILIAGLAIVASLVVDSHGVNFHRIGEIQSELTQFVARYDDVRTQLKSLAVGHSGHFREFLLKVHEVVWFLPFGLMITAVLEGFFYPYALFFFIGCIGLARRCKHTPLLGYFICLIVFSLVVLYIHLLQTWLIDNRFLSILIFPSCLLIGFGIEQTLRFLTQKVGLKPAVAMGWVVVIILAFGLGKNIRPNQADKIVYRQIADIIAAQKKPDQVAPIAALASTEYEWVFFYAHIDFPGLLCSRSMTGQIPEKYQQLPEVMRRDGRVYLFYEENEWRTKRYDFTALPYEKEFEVLGRWHHKDTGAMMLLKLRQD